MNRGVDWHDYEMYNDFNICDECEVGQYCNLGEYAQMDDRCIYYDLNDVYYYWDKETDDLAEYSEEEQKTRSKRYEEIIRQRVLIFLKKRKTIEVRYNGRVMFNEQ